ncbi:hypothetical protein M441DRAFT_303848 [Trichoderma asperellum CBS 433.97]|uniref:Uncharacterized protein n=1 Tax=Trichoderma asperellum (strain ATCC 204424 / CBS 433.97 / NBRC 101777) TaxID=1042311 RepID=A0A2T3ZJM6_TRIA4|nr:hypothetical protein M441DRAFT_303848 [Trichoderma asperellum CBS 433.97]PTB45018.1 hypothetical protein M441DRAFT_303848 [Trichoderma asperellum CBS 433.97]
MCVCNTWYWADRRHLISCVPVSYRSNRSLLAAKVYRVGLTKTSDMCLWTPISTTPSLSLLASAPQNSSSAADTAPVHLPRSLFNKPRSRVLSASASPPPPPPLSSWQRATRLSRFVLVHRNHPALFCIDGRWPARGPLPKSWQPSTQARQKGCPAAPPGISALQLVEHGRC